MKKIVIGILAHVDAGKTTLAEAMLFKAGKLRNAGRVDHGDTLLDSHSLEKKRGITIFASQARFTHGNTQFTLLDTPGHVDFSSETERTLQVIDYAVLVISGIDEVQAHTRTLWRLLKLYNIPTFIFVTKMDFARISQSEIIDVMQKELDPSCIDFSSENNANFFDNIAFCSDELLEKYLDGNSISEHDITTLIRSRKVFPCFFGSGLKFDGVDDFLDLLDKYTFNPIYPSVFGAKVFKITHDPQGNRVTHLKITGGTLKVRDSIQTGEAEEKVNQIRLYSGAKSTTIDESQSGEICAVTGLNNTKNGQGLGFETSSDEPILEPVMTYRVVLPENCSAVVMLPKLRQLEEEDPLLRVRWDPNLQEIHVDLMGEVHAEILKSLILENFETDVQIDSGKVLYKETITDTVEGVGHYEPLRHYAEVHLLMEPMPTGSGLVFASKCSEDILDRNWQRLIMIHLHEKQHLGVLTGSPITDIRITLVAGRAHLKHTEGGDFRQATYRAVRQGLMQAKSKILEPYYYFRIEVPNENIGRAISDIRLKHGTINSPEDYNGMSVLKGKAPVVTLNGYAAEIASYTGGRGRISVENAGYDDCHNEQEVIKEYFYQPESDLDNVPDSVFCAHGAGFNVRWDKVKDYMHIESCLKKDIPYTPAINHRNFHIDDKELEAIMEREFGPVKYDLYRHRTEYSSEKNSTPDFALRQQYVIIDGYNVIFAWDDLKALAQQSLESARQRLMEILCNYSAFTQYKVVLVFDAYKVAGNNGSKFDFHNIHVVYTKENELGDVYIEKLIADIGKNDKVKVVTSDGLIQLSAVRFGVLRMSALEFEKEIDDVHSRIGKILDDINNAEKKTNIGDVADSSKI